MDPITQGALGAALPQATRSRAHGAIAGALGFLAGLAADLDVVIRSAADPLLFLEYHRQFTHSLVFVPFGGLLVALALHWLVGRRWRLTFRETVILCTLGFATHALLDAATSYGTMLLWPFSEARISWRIISVVDPLFTLPLLALVGLSMAKGKPLYAKLGLVWAGTYLALGALQHQGAIRMAQEIAAERGHTPVRLEVKPSFGNIVVWKTLYEASGRYYVDAVRPGPGPRTFSGTSIAKLNLARDFAWLPPESQQAKDVERFRHFSNDFLALRPGQGNSIIDVRYSMVPNAVAGLWSIELDPAAAGTAHVAFRTHRRNSGSAVKQLWAMIVSR